MVRDLGAFSSQTQEGGIFNYHHWLGWSGQDGVLCIFGMPTFPNCCVADSTGEDKDFV